MTRPTSATPIADFDIRLLRVFKTIVEEGGLKAATAALDVSLPTISKQLSDLEARLGARLCERGSRRFELTPEGHVLYKAAVDLFVGIGQFEFEIDQMKIGKKGELRLAVIDNVISDDNCPLIGALTHMQKNDVHIRLSVLDPDTILSKISEGRLDAGIVPVYRKWAGLEYRVLYSEQMSLYCGQSHPLFHRHDDVCERELIDHDFVEHGYVDVNEIDDFAPVGKAGATAWQVEAVAILLMTGRYLGYLPDHYAEPLIRKGKIRRLLKDSGGYRTNVALVHRVAARPSRPLKMLFSALDEALTSAKTLVAGERAINSEMSFKL
ncbi:LysR family transcriptional regulator [Bosea sp. (in: a-proteobacteria)]|uniref:LysR family transcriptional regulator n=1 Tax=Bosea sp. (in: a-proteobacteria) TaxID=1871050 RepID=UPI0026094D00|nr:LysR family transcriptional regulator [Bosea sp. (in: a-proteobacteria)]MCO5091306.1 LysR family transcriptional regulator [Bosea sp. (in: a-proteobacteria)]